MIELLKHTYGEVLLFLVPIILDVFVPYCDPAMIVFEHMNLNS